MKKIILPFILALLFIGANAQETGMHFEHNTTWKNILAKAKAENKYIFLDCFTTWCGPCKMMSSTIFPKTEVGDLYNAKYINAGAQMDTSRTKDNEEVKSWYATSHEIAVKYNVNAYPTYLIFNPNGELVDRFLGSMTANEFIAKGKDALVPEKQYYTSLRRFKAGERNPDFLYKLGLATYGANDLVNAETITKAYLATQTNLYTKTTLELVQKTTNNSNDQGFRMMLDNPEKVDSVLGAGTSYKIVRWIIFNEDISPFLPKETETVQPDWVATEKKLSTKYPTMAKKEVLFARWFYYNVNHDFKNFTLAIDESLKMDENIFDSAQLNQFAWTIFQNCKDMTCIKSAIMWSKKSFAKNNNYQFIDTYANLLMKAGKKQEAINWETKAVAMAKEKNDPSVGEYKETLNTMKEKQNTPEATRQGDHDQEPQ